MSVAEDDMDWQPSAQARHRRHQRQAYIASLSFDVFLELVRRLEVWDVVNLRVVCEILSFLFWQSLTPLILHCLCRLAKHSMNRLAPFL